MQYRHPTITERQRQREIGQVRDTHRRIGMVQVRQTGNGRSGQGRVGKGSVGCDAVQYAVTKRGFSAGEDGCLRGRDPWEPRTADSTGQVRSPWMRCGPDITPRDNDGCTHTGPP